MMRLVDLLAMFPTWDRFMVVCNTQSNERTTIEINFSSYTGGVYQWDFLTAAISHLEMKKGMLYIHLI